MNSQFDSNELFTPNINSLRKLLIFRIIGVILMILLFIFELTQEQILYILSMFTQYGIFFTTILFIFNAYFTFQKSKEIEIKTTFLRITSILFQVCWSADVTITVGFWLILLPIGILEGDNSNRVSLAHMFYYLFAHSVPMILILIDYLMNQIHFRFFDYIFSASLLALYVVVSGICWLTYGYFPYEEYLGNKRSVRILFCITLILVHAYSEILAKVIEIFKRRKMMKNQFIYTNLTEEKSMQL